jgi:alpha-glucosidase
MLWHTKIPMPKSSSHTGNRLFLRQFSPAQWLVLTVFFLVAGPVAAQENVSQTPQGLRVAIGQAQVELAVVNADTLRLSVAGDPAVGPAPSTFLADTNGVNAVAWKRVEVQGLVGIKTQAGALLINPQTGEWTLENAQGDRVIPLHELGVLNPQAAGARPEVRLQVGWNGQKPIMVYGCGNGVDSLEQSRTTTRVSNGEAVIPYYWSPSGYAVLAVSANDNQPATWRGAAEGDCVTWTFPGTQADLYLMPAASLKDAARAYSHLTGSAPVPPRWAFGYLQSRWGWQNRAYIEDTVKHFQDLKLPVDAFIFDFEWYTTTPDYGVPPEGLPTFSDFNWNANLFPEPAAQIKALKDQGVHFVGIRKPRMGNSETLAMMRSNNWVLALNKGFEARDVNFANPGMSDWYVKQSADLLAAGVDGWWNDEGEGTYTIYFYWNQTEARAWSLDRTNQRMWTLNRAFSPGVQRFGAAAWTGDINASWKDLGETPTSLLNWGLAGMPYCACDIGGFNQTPTPELLTRWMEAGVFFPVMRAHSTVMATPHFPWLYGTSSLNAMREALDLRYRLIPYYYSLAHETFDTGVPIMRSLAMEFPGDPQVANVSDEWMMGGSLLAAPVLKEGGRRSVHLPAGDWYGFETNRVVRGNSTFELAAALDEIPLYVRAGTILPLAPVVQHTSELPGGPLELEIYPGQDATFTLVEDDGLTLNYLKGDVRRTEFKWDDSGRRLSWKRTGEYAGPDVFQELRVVLFGPQGRVEVPPQALSKSGRVKF